MPAVQHKYPFSMKMDLALLDVDIKVVREYQAAISC